MIGMTNLQEAKLAREAEICYVTVAMVTDYDCWHPEHDAVTVNDIIANLVKNAENACRVVAEAVAEMPAARQAASRVSLIWGQMGSAKLMWATRPSPKKVEMRPRVRSKNWSGRTKSCGRCCSWSEPTALKEMMRSTPSDFRP